MAPWSHNGEITRGTLPIEQLVIVAEMNAAVGLWGHVMVQVADVSLYGFLSGPWSEHPGLRLGIKYTVRQQSSTCLLLRDSMTRGLLTGASHF